MACSQSHILIIVTMKWRGYSLFRVAPGSGMSIPVHLDQMRGVYMCIPLCGGQAGMSQLLLDGAQICPSPQ